MIRILLFLVLITLAAAGLTLLASVEGNVDLRFGDLAYNASSNATLLALAFGLFLLVLVVLVTSYLMRLPGKLARRREAGRRERGMMALTRGLEAVAVGDPVDAQRHARQAQRQLEEPGLTRLLTAQAAHLAGDHETAGAAYSAMLDAPETEFLGLRGLYLQSIEAGDRKAAKGYADRAFNLRPNARWAYESVYHLSVEDGAWSDARNALKLASRNGLEEGDHIRRRDASLLTARAYAADASGDHEAALKDASAAFREAPDFSPAATLAARLQNAAGHRSRAAKILEEAWAARPHPAIRQAWLDLYTDLAEVPRKQKLAKLIEKAPETPQSRQIEAEIALASDRPEEAKAILEDLLTDNPTGRTYTLMAATMRTLHGEAAAELWLVRAADAPSEGGPGADKSFHFTTDGWRRLVEEYGEHDRLAPPPLEDTSAAMSREEVRLLAAPPPAPVPETDLVEEPATGSAEEGAEGPPAEDQPAAEAGDAPDVAPVVPEEKDGDSPGGGDESVRKEREEQRRLEEAEASLNAARLGGGITDPDEDDR